ncbi:DUF1365 domain-containing protein [Gordonia sp. PKS22-38]|uniref:DUF1365 domain-containing protein n=1 Tax=Gordonia prachuapensis TaxID=3115651 RepID=A0ABU7N1L6_9ACTN|nr:DUF1365 domain-containing protein [Gordonia sp. PKS22-38]
MTTPTGRDDVAVPAVVHTRIRHVRTSPVRHAFTHRSASWLIDVDHPARVPLPLRPFARFRAADHFPQAVHPHDTLRSRLDDQLAAAGVDAPSGRVVALLSPRVAGHVFNPLSVFWCHDSGGSLSCVVAEVHNTYGERHCYVVIPDARGDAVVPKEFYVSPFNEVDGTYRLHVPPPSADGAVAVSVTLERDGQDPFTASVSGRARPATTAAIIRTQLAAPLAPLVVSARIRMHGIRLWFKRLPVVTRPEHRNSLTIAGCSASATDSRKDDDERSAS